MNSQRIDGYMSREISLEFLNGEIQTYRLHIVKPGNPTSYFPHSGNTSRLRILFSDYEIIPYSQEIPFVYYSDKEIRIKEISSGEFEMLI